MPKWKEPELTTLIREVGVGTNMQSKQARVLQSKAGVGNLLLVTGQMSSVQLFGGPEFSLIL